MATKPIKITIESWEVPTLIDILERAKSHTTDNAVVNCCDAMLRKLRTN